MILSWDAPARWGAGVALYAAGGWALAVVLEDWRLLPVLVIVGAGIATT